MKLRLIPRVESFELKVICPNEALAQKKQSEKQLTDLHSCVASERSLPGFQSLATISIHHPPAVYGLCELIGWKTFIQTAANETVVKSPDTPSCHFLQCVYGWGMGMLESFNGQVVMDAGQHQRQDWLTVYWFINDRRNIRANQNLFVGDIV